MTKTRIVTCQYKELENDLGSFLYGCGALERIDGETLEDLNKRSARMRFEIG